MQLRNSWFGHFPALMDKSRGGYSVQGKVYSLGNWSSEVTNRSLCIQACTSFCDPVSQVGKNQCSYGVRTGALQKGLKRKDCIEAGRV